MLKKFSAAVLISLLLTNSAVQAYDLPKIKPDKKVAKTEKVMAEKGIVLKGDWKDADLFEQKMKAILASGKELAPDDPARVPGDKNYVFVAFYKDVPYFLDRYSLKVKETANGAQTWEQNIFPISKTLSPQRDINTPKILLRQRQVLQLDESQRRLGGRQRRGRQDFSAGMLQSRLPLRFRRTSTDKLIFELVDFGRRIFFAHDNRKRNRPSRNCNA